VRRFSQAAPKASPTTPSATSLRRLRPLSAQIPASTVRVTPAKNRNENWLKGFKATSSRGALDRSFNFR
jgi:hypothetical protein